MILTYWVAETRGDAKCYNLRARTKREVEALKTECGAELYRAAHKVTVEYADGFDLMNQCLSEGGLYEGAEPL